MNTQEKNIFSPDSVSRGKKFFRSSRIEKGHNIDKAIKEMEKHLNNIQKAILKS